MLQRDMALGGRSLVSGLQVFGVLAVAVVAAAFAPLLLPGPRTTDGSTPPAPASVVVARIPGVGPSPAVPSTSPTSATAAADAFPDSALGVATARETAAAAESGSEGHRSDRSGFRRLPRSSDERRAQSKAQGHSAPSAGHGNGRKVRAHGSPSPGHSVVAKPGNGPKHGATAHGHGPKPKAKKAKKR